MSPRSRSLVQRVRDHLGFSVVAIGVLFIVLRLLGVRSTFAGFAMSVAITLALNVGLSYYSEYRARHPRPAREARGGGDIRFREDDPRPARREYHDDDRPRDGRYDDRYDDDRRLDPRAEDRRVRDPRDGSR